MRDDFMVLDGNDASDPMFKVKFFRRDGDGHATLAFWVALDDMEALQLANGLIGWLTQKKELAVCVVEAEREAEMAIPA
jgi:hypothetical protein